MPRGASHRTMILWKLGDPVLLGAALLSPATPLPGSLLCNILFIIPVARSSPECQQPCQPPEVSPSSQVPVLPSLDLIIFVQSFPLTHLTYTHTHTTHTHSCAGAQKIENTQGCFFWVFLFPSMGSVQHALQQTSFIPSAAGEVPLGFL